MSRLSKEARDALIRSGEAGFVVRSMPPGSVGDVNSDAKGSGARFNAGKPPYELVPVGMLQAYYAFAKRWHGPGNDAVGALGELGNFQARVGDAHDTLMSALYFLRADGWEECARVFDYGRAKYAAWNWAKGMAWSIPLACAVRHLLAMVGGEDIDPESGLPHRGHVFCNIVMLYTFVKTYSEGDDRPAAGLLAPRPGLLP